MWAAILFPNMLGAITLKYYKACLWNGWGLWPQSPNLSRGQCETEHEQRCRPFGGIVGRSLEVWSARSIPVSAWRAPWVSRTLSSWGDPCHVDRVSQKEMAGEVDFYFTAMLWQNSHPWWLFLILPPWYSVVVAFYSGLFLIYIPNSESMAGSRV